MADRVREARRFAHCLAVVRRCAEAGEVPGEFTLKVVEELEVVLRTIGQAERDAFATTIHKKDGNATITTADGRRNVTVTVYGHAVYLSLSKRQMPICNELLRPLAELLLSRAAEVEGEGGRADAGS